MRQIILALTALVALAAAASWWSVPASGHAGGKAARIDGVKIPQGDRDTIFTRYAPAASDPAT